ncbi:hypothetical protein BUALT_Bualt16G0070600 [Buddleja alternifolia]|uniref:Phytocyanin domain-containing protein n=1 Tax=Buddleja alternifolia TaxID=168488 RepID=A0AAV6WHH6_9LAMI|nr:hypothetical protein BUALT_Bualt16G0070600 [Buddleja alternifolia]
MAAFNRGILLLVVVMAAAELFGNAAAATYVVGDSLGWRVPPGGATDYATWASQHVFRVGDILVFNFITGAHDVAKVAQRAYDGCASTNPIALATVGPASFTLNSTGPDFYICTFGQHCSLGQKLTINVTSPSTTPTPAAPAPSPSTTMPPPTTMPVSPAPAPAPHTVMPTPTTSPSGAPSPSSIPSPAPGSNTTPSTSPTSEMSPESGPPPSSTSTGDLSPPPPPNSATITTIRAPIIVFALIIFGLAI